MPLDDLYFSDTEPEPAIANPARPSTSPFRVRGDVPSEGDVLVVDRDVPRNWAGRRIMSLTEGDRLVEHRQSQSGPMQRHLRRQRPTVGGA
jgi:hypothetical protein